LNEAAARRLGLSLIVGILAGIAATAFLASLAWATHTREMYPVLIYGLPLVGLLIGWVYHDIGRDSAPGNNLVLDEIHEPSKTLPLKMAPLILISTVLTHLFGGSAGREGTAVQMGASLADQLTRFVPKKERRFLLRAGMGAGFGAAIGAPWAGAVFGLEVLYTGRFEFEGWLENLLASFAAFGTTLVLHAPHTHYPQIHPPLFSLSGLLAAGMCGIAFGLTSRLFVWLTHLLERAEAKLIRRPPLKPFVVGFFLIAFYFLVGNRYAGLGLPVIQQALTDPVSIKDPLWKSIATILTIGSGFKGGEFIPLVFIGTTLGSALAALLVPTAQQILPAVGFAAVFGSAANTPLACTIMAVEIFDWSIAPYALIGCYIAYWVSGRKGIYRTQKENKRDWLIRAFSSPNSRRK
jgi:H+/Cl- antiporter ClcA